jgi:hypothetical protein
VIESVTIMAHKIAAALLRFSIVSSPICGRATRLLIVAVHLVQRPGYLHQIAIAIDASRNIAEVVVEFFHLTRQAVDGETVAEQCLNADSLRWIEAACGLRVPSQARTIALMPPPPINGMS